MITEYSTPNKTFTSTVPKAHQGTSRKGRWKEYKSWRVLRRAVKLSFWNDTAVAPMNSQQLWLPTYGYLHNIRPVIIPDGWERIHAYLRSYGLMAAGGRVIFFLGNSC